MATSGSTIWELTRDQLITSALKKIGALAKGQSPDAEDLADGTLALNAILAKLQTIGMPLWARNDYVFSLTDNVAVYQIGVGRTLNTPFPLKIQQALLTDINSETNIEMEIRAIYDYNRFSPDQSSGQPVQLYYQPLNGYGIITVWPTPDAAAAAQKQIQIVYQRPFEDFVSATDTPDFPKEYTQAIIYELALALAPQYGLPIQDRQQLQKEYKEYKDEALSFGTDEASFFWQPYRDI